DRDDVPPRGRVPGLPGRARDERVTEGDVEVDGARVAGAGAGRGGERTDDHLAGGGRGRVGGQVRLPARRGGEDADLLGGLAGAGAAQLVGAVGAEDDEGDAAVRGLEDGRVEVGDGRAGGRDDGGGHAVGAGQAEGDEPGHPLVDAHVQAQPPGVV